MMGAGAGCVTDVLTSAVTFSTSSQFVLSGDVSSIESERAVQAPPERWNQAEHWSVDRVVGGQGKTSGLRSPKIVPNIGFQLSHEPVE